MNFLHWICTSNLSKAKSGCLNVKAKSFMASHRCLCSGYRNALCFFLLPHNCTHYPLISRSYAWLADALLYELPWESFHRAIPSELLPDLPSLMWACFLHLTIIPHPDSPRPLGTWVNFNCWLTRFFPARELDIHLYVCKVAHINVQKWLVGELIFIPSNNIKLSIRMDPSGF